MQKDQFTTQEVERTRDVLVQLIYSLGVDKIRQLADYCADLQQVNEKLVTTSLTF